MFLLFSADRRWGIGKGNDLLYRRQGDMSFFRRKTVGNLVIMGRRTLESLPEGKPLPERENLILTRNPDYHCPGAWTAHSLEELFELLALPGRDGMEKYVIGGGEILQMLAPYCVEALVTRWDAVADADRFAPDFDRMAGWRLTEASPVLREKELDYRFCTYRNDQPQPWRPSPGDCSQLEAQTP